MQLGKEEKEGGRHLRQETCGKRVFPEHVGLEARKLRPGPSKIEAWRLQNRGPEPPKSSPESSKNAFKSGKIEPQSLENRDPEAPKSSPERSKT